MKSNVTICPNGSKQTESKYAVLKRFKDLNGKIWEAPIYDYLGRPVKFNIVALPAEHARFLYYSGVITDDLPGFIAGKIIHPENKRLRRK